jgi:hypothetical protein
VRKAIAQAREELDMLFGRLRGEVFRQLSEHARALGAELSRHHDDLATDLKRAIERGSRLIANNESARNEREDQLREAVAALDRPMLSSSVTCPTTRFVRGGRSRQTSWAIKLCVLRQVRQGARCQQRPEQRKRALVVI